MLSARAVITIRGAFRYVSRDALEDAMWAMRMLLDRSPSPLRFRCWITTPRTLSIDLAVPMFAEHDVGPAVCETLGATATSARCVVRAQRPLADGTGATRRAPSSHDGGELTRVLDELSEVA